MKIGKHIIGNTDESSTISHEKGMLRMAGSICEGRHHIHTCGYLHGDMKSNNIFIAKENSNLVPKIIDFEKSFSYGIVEMKKNTTSQNLSTLVWHKSCF